MVMIVGKLIQAGLLRMMGAVVKLETLQVT